MGSTTLFNTVFNSPETGCVIFAVYLSLTALFHVWLMKLNLIENLNVGIQNGVQMFTFCC